MCCGHRASLHKDPWPSSVQPVLPCSDKFCAYPGAGWKGRQRWQVEPGFVSEQVECTCEVLLHGDPVRATLHADTGGLPPGGPGPLIYWLSFGAEGLSVLIQVVVPRDLQTL